MEEECAVSLTGSFSFVLKEVSDFLHAVRIESPSFVSVEELYVVFADSQFFFCVSGEEVSPFCWEIVFFRELTIVAIWIN